VVKWAIVRIMLRRRSFIVVASVIRAEGLIVTCSLALEANGASHIQRKNFIDK
jgi:hypothetical protein